MKTESLTKKCLFNSLRAIIAFGVCTMAILVPPIQTMGQNAAPSDLESELVAGNWRMLTTNNVEGAIGHFCKAVANGVLMEWRIMEAEGNLGRAGGKDVDAFCDGMLKRNPKNAFVRFAIATRLYDRGESTKALAEYQQAADLDPKFAPSFYQIGCHYEIVGNQTEKLKWMEKAIAADTDYSPAYVGKATSLKARGELDAAIEQCKKGAEVLETKNIRSGEQLGRACYNWGWILINRPVPDNDQAITVLSKAIKADPLRFEAYNELGIAYKRKSMFAEAIKAYKDGISKGDKSATIYFNLGVSEYRSGHKQEAITAFEKASSLEPNGQMGSLARQWRSQIR